MVLIVFVTQATSISYPLEIAWEEMTVSVYGEQRKFSSVSFLRRRMVTALKYGCNFNNKADV